MALRSTAGIPPLSRFLLTRSVLRLYRQAVRTAYRSPDRTARTELVQFARSEFSAPVTNEDQVRYMVAMGERRLHETAQQMGLAAGSRGPAA